MFQQLCIGALALILPAIVLCQSVSEEDAAIRKMHATIPSTRLRQERFQIKELVTSKSVRVSYKKTLDGLKTARNSDCVYYPKDRCIGSLLKPPFPAILGRDQLRRESQFFYPDGSANPEKMNKAAISPYVSWAPSNVVQQGSSLISLYKEMATSRLLFACDSSELSKLFCQYITYTASPSGIVFSVCTVPWDRADRNPPLRCVPVGFKEAAGDEWIVILSQEELGTGGPRDDFSLLILTQTVLPKNSLGTFIKKALTSPPLGLDVSTLISGIKGLSEYRDSKVLPSWREFARVNVSWEEDCDYKGVGQIRGKPLDNLKSAHAYCIDYSCQLWVNLQNTSKPSDWSKPSEIQERLYERAVGKALKQNLSSLCSAPIWESSETMRCK